VLEIEAKFYVRDFEDLRLRLGSLGAVLIEPRHHENNLRFDTAEGSLTAAGCVLRLRECGRTLLTFKQPVEKDIRREELEIEVSDGPSAQALLERLGFRVIGGYEKWRETHSLGPCRVMLDELPYGHFVEVEAPDESLLEHTASSLGLAWGHRVRETYLQLLDRVRRERKLDPGAVTFDRFASLPAPSPVELGVKEGLTKPFS
jgi:adenylate cyclase class 2